jgi:L-iditol 2-dehydrogenase
MKAIVKTEEGRGHVCLREVPEPVVSPGCVKIEVDSSGICGTDLKIRAGETWSNPPVILGHEFSGIVTEVGAGVACVSPGDRVVSETAAVICGHCHYCNTGDYLMCPERLSIGYGVDGAFASHIVVRQGIIHKIPDGVSLKEAALCEPLAVAVHAVFDSIALKPTDTVVVAGPGAIGLLVMQVAGAFGARVIVAGVSSDADRLEIARGLGACRTIDTQREDAVSIVRELTEGMGADYVFDCSGALPAILMGFEWIRRKGTIVQVGLTQQNLELPYAMLPQREIAVKGTFGHNWLSWDRALKLLARKQVNAQALISGAYAMEDWEKAFDQAEGRQGVKILLHPNREADAGDGRSAGR